MVKKRKIFTAITRTQFIIIAAAVLIILAAAFFLFSHYAFSGVNNYLVENKSYGFKLQTPKNWFAEGKTHIYSDNSISQLLSQCEKDKLDGNTVYEVGKFRFKSQAYPQGFGDMGFFAAGFPSGGILDITVACIPDGVKDGIINNSYGNLEMAGEKTLETSIGLLGFGDTKYLSFMHNGLQYKISEYVYISPFDKDSEGKIRASYASIFNIITSSFKLTK